MVNLVKKKHVKKLDVSMVNAWMDFVNVTNVGLVKIAAKPCAQEIATDTVHVKRMSPVNALKAILVLGVKMHRDVWMNVAKVNAHRSKVVAGNANVLLV